MKPYFLLPLLVAAMVALMLTAPARAATCGSSGVVEILAEVSLSPYTVTVGVLPPKPKRGNVRLIVAVCDAASGQPREDVQVSMVPTSPSGATGAPIHALNRYTNPGEYSADITVKEAGLWHYLVEVVGPSGRAEFTAAAEIAPSSAHEETTTTVIFLVTIAFLFVGSIYFYVVARRHGPV